ncbi:hypothetical protein HYC85_024789 [Camellia sinensis]|uniref:Uncharacterized protein n=1 Tax=Camellia sinensis TaxID=4442 RepID=A0A7J7G942_CAMSI|nr:hypothetical protein HYC85_024789 [Camellia sinensis]
MGKGRRVGTHSHELNWALRPNAKPFLGAQIETHTVTEPLLFSSLLSGIGMPLSFSKLGNSLPFSRLFRQLEQEMETVIKVLEPGPLGVVEHKFSAEEICEANATV